MDSFKKLRKPRQSMGQVLFPEGVLVIKKGPKSMDGACSQVFGCGEMFSGYLTKLRCENNHTPIPQPTKLTVRQACVWLSGKHMDEAAAIIKRGVMRDSQRAFLAFYYCIERERQVQRYKQENL